MAEGKDPAFLFYYVEFENGTKYMTDEEVGVYVRLLCEQADKWTIKPKIFDRIIGDRPTIKETILEKFLVDEEGNYFNKRLREEQRKRKEYTKSRLKNLHIIPHMDKHKEEHIKPHTLNRNRNRNKDRNKDRNEIVITNSFPLKEDVLNYFTESGYPIEMGESFFSYYDAQEWCTTGGASIAKRWQSKVQGWVNNQKEYSRNKKSNQEGTIIDHNPPK